MKAILALTIISLSFTACRAKGWAKDQEIDMIFIEKGKPHQNSYGTF
jgi:hypothetical protein